MADPSIDPEVSDALPVVPYESAGEFKSAPIATPPNGIAALVWAIVAVALAPYVCLSVPIGSVAVMAAVWTLYQPRNVKRAYRRCAIAALVVMAVASVALIAGVVQFFEHR